MELSAFRQACICLAQGQEPDWNAWGDMYHNEQDILMSTMVHNNDPNVIVSYLVNGQERNRLATLSKQHQSRYVLPVLSTSQLDQIVAACDAPGERGWLWHMIRQSSCHYNNPSMIHWAMDKDVLHSVTHNPENIAPLEANAGLMGQWRHFDVAFALLDILHTHFQVPTQELKNRYPEHEHGDLYTRYEKHMLMQNVNPTTASAKPKVM